MKGTLEVKRSIQKDVVRKLMFICTKIDDPRVQKFIESLHNRSV